MSKRTPKEAAMIGSGKAAKLLLKKTLNRTRCTATETVRSLIPKALEVYSIPVGFPVPTLLYPYEFPLLKETLCARELPTPLYDMGQVNSFFLYDPLLAGSHFWVGVDLSSVHEVAVSKVNPKFVLHVKGKRSDGNDATLVFIPANQFFQLQVQVDKEDEAVYEE
jgi:hypothetical protein